MSNMIRLLVADGASTRYLKRVKDCPVSSSFHMMIPKNDAEDSLLSLAPNADTILCYKAEITGSVIRAATSLRFIQKHGLNCECPAGPLAPDIISTRTCHRFARMGDKNQ